MYINAVSRRAVIINQPPALLSCRLLLSFVSLSLLKGLAASRAARPTPTALLC